MQKLKFKKIKQNTTEREFHNQKKLFNLIKVVRVDKARKLTINKHEIMKKNAFPIMFALMILIIIVAKYFQ